MSTYLTLCDTPLTDRLHLFSIFFHVVPCNMYDKSSPHPITIIELNDNLMII